MKRATDSFLGVPSQCFQPAKAAIGVPPKRGGGRQQYCANVVSCCAVHADLKMQRSWELLACSHSGRISAASCSSRRMLGRSHRCTCTFSCKQNKRPHWLTSDCVTHNQFLQALKINAKLGGVNHMLNTKPMPWMDAPFAVFGAHPSPSICADPTPGICANLTLSMHPMCICAHAPPNVQDFSTLVGSGRLTCMPGPLPDQARM